MSPIDHCLDIVCSAAKGIDISVGVLDSVYDPAAEGKDAEREETAGAALNGEMEIAINVEDSFEEVPIALQKMKGSDIDPSSNFLF